jgi:hypothetical protein
LQTHGTSLFSLLLLLAAPVLDVVSQQRQLDEPHPVHVVDDVRREMAFDGEPAEIAVR